MYQIFLIATIALTIMTLTVPFSAAANPAKKTIVILMGPPGSGKGTQAGKISSTFNIPHISTGDILRENIRNQTPLGVEAKKYVEAGKYVPDDLILDVLFDRVSKEDAKNGYLLDGFPRTIPQAEALQKRFTDKDCVVAINLDVSDEVIVKRISGRLTCPDCGAVYNEYFKPPKEEGVCDKCGAKPEHRADDNAETVKERLATYYRQTKPVLDYYQSKEVLHTLNGEEPTDQISDQMVTLIKKKCS